MKKLGLFLFIFSWIPWVIIILIVPLLTLNLTQKALLVGILLLIAEISFWLSIVILGKEVVTRYRRYFNPRLLWQKIKKMFL
jgi:hypothetical protein